MKILAVITLMISGNSFAATNTYDVKMSLSIKGKDNFPSHIVAEEGKVATIIQNSVENKDEKTFVDILASKKVLKNSKEGISIKFTAGTIDNNGKRYTQFNTQIIALENQLAEIREDDLSLFITATKKNQ